MSPVETGGNRTLLPSIASSTTSTNLANNGEPGQDSNFILIVILILSAIVIVVGIAIVSVLLYRKGGFRTVGLSVDYLRSCVHSGSNSSTDEEGENKGNHLCSKTMK
ncbi:uncharacterized protein [Ptychodera flava]|uniref:uncharacterized protein n=1 Tax=Ptychodera flava TaxID=63121 RepID=UPI00396AA6D5